MCIRRPCTFDTCKWSSVIEAYFEGKGGRIIRACFWVHGGSSAQHAFYDRKQIGIIINVTSHELTYQEAKVAFVLFLVHMPLLSETSLLSLTILLASSFLLGYLEITKALIFFNYLSIGAGLGLSWSWMLSRVVIYQPAAQTSQSIISCLNRIRDDLHALFHAESPEHTKERIKI